MHRFFEGHEKQKTQDPNSPKTGAAAVGKISTERFLTRGKNEDRKEKKAEMPYLHCTEILMHMLIMTHQEDEPDIARSSGINRRRERSESRQPGQDRRERSHSRQPERAERAEQLERRAREPREPPTTARYCAPREPSNPPSAHRARERRRSNTPQRNTRYRTDGQARDTNRQYGQQQNCGGHWHEHRLPPIPTSPTVSTSVQPTILGPGESVV